MSDERATLICVHGLGLDAHLFDRVGELLANDAEVVAIDLPGFGGSPATDEPLFDASIAAVESVLRDRAPESWIAVGHSMGGKVVTMVTARSLEGHSGIPAPAAVVLLAASPPSPEPMDESRRQQMLGWVSRAAISAEHARAFVDGNTASRLTEWADSIAMEAVERSAPSAWRSWLTDGSLQNVATGLRLITVPAAIAAGADDGDLGVVAQREHNLPHYPLGRVHVIDGAAHFLPLEQPQAVTELIRGVLPSARRS